MPEGQTRFGGQSMLLNSLSTKPGLSHPGPFSCCGRRKEVRAELTGGDRNFSAPAPFHLEHPVKTGEFQLFGVIDPPGECEMCHKKLAVVFAQSGLLLIRLYAY